MASKQQINSQVITQQGEVTVNINLTLTIKVDNDGSVSVMQEQQKITPVKPIQYQSSLELPDLGEPEEIINFGKEM